MSAARTAPSGVLRGLVRAYLSRRYALVFYSLLLTLVAVPVSKELGLPDALIELFWIASLLAAVLGMEGWGRWHALPIFLAATVALRMVAALLHAPSLAIVTLPLMTLVALLAAAAALRYALRAAAVDAEHVYAALSAYLLAGIFFGVLYWAIDRTWAGSLADAAAPAGLSRTSAIYFSFVTLATLGYGDIVPRTDVTRGLAIVEAIAGQLYLAVMVARLVTLYVRQPAGGKET